MKHKWQKYGGTKERHKYICLKCGAKIGCEKHIADKYVPCNKK